MIRPIIRAVISAVCLSAVVVLTPVPGGDAAIAGDRAGDGVAPAAGMQAAGAAVVAALQRGGLVMVMRHASAPAAPPARDAANADNLSAERQLDAAGRAAATAMGEALKRLRIPIGEVAASPTYRARETARLLGFPDATLVEELGDGGQSMQGVAEAQAAWLRERVTHAASRGNVLLITHMPNIGRAFPSWGAVADGEAIVLRPGAAAAGSATGSPAGSATASVEIVGRIKIEEWPALR